jgi:hypothetical protein
MYCIIVSQFNLYRTSSGEIEAFFHRLLTRYFWPSPARADFTIMMTALTPFYSRLLDRYFKTT